MVIGMREHLDEEVRDPHAKGQVQCDRRGTAGHSSRRVQKPCGAYLRITRRTSALRGSLSRTSRAALPSPPGSPRIPPTQPPRWDDPRAAAPSTKPNNPKGVVS